ncbi:conserved hypothetical protein [Verticillium alfalfae VaMs.102]|uniref:IBR domain-containing protein n=1 Tax=Verticillium alfalfae (strain VaMs.102 / ATCC MYA-4576 / FGSC 10136) TaxID=526221 RepID=C9SLP3_VERA1|nr:conserved hypothetical protein [Verticillium alfalfae VaMs.102]EEY19611.1 conserved hypothetical protein [Verticillium alfalfae VaMs.102]
MHQADNFIWCAGGCGSGQIHETGAEQPIVICLHCSGRSCFTHEVAWHDGLTCEEFDSLLADPENFRSRIEVENAAVDEEEARRRAQDAVDHALAGRLAADQEAEERARVERDKQARRKAAEAAEKARKTAARRKREDEQSMATMNRTTKKCPGCSWAIEKNSGCSHMTCTYTLPLGGPIVPTRGLDALRLRCGAYLRLDSQFAGLKCRFEFCWGCYRRWGACRNIQCTGPTAS